MFNLRDFIKEGLLGAVGKMADYQVILNSAGWFEKGVLLQEDLEKIQALINTRNESGTDTSEEYQEVSEEND